MKTLNYWNWNNPSDISGLPGKSKLARAKPTTRRKTIK
jgi:hypothetical protein